MITDKEDVTEDLSLSTVLHHLSHYGIHNQSIRHLRSSVNETFLVDGKRYILRMYREGVPDVYAKGKELATVRAQRLYDAGANVVPPAAIDPFSEQGWVSTLWMAGDAGNVSHGELFEALLSLHQIQDTSVVKELGLAPMNVVGTVRASAEKFWASESGSGEIGEFLHDLVENCETSHARLVEAGGDVVHLDGYVGNVVWFDGRPCLIDLDTLSLGPWQYDFVVPYSSFLCAGGGVRMDSVPCEVFEWSLFEDAMRVRFADVFSRVCAMSVGSEVYRNEMMVRFVSLKHGSFSPWNMKL